MKCNVDQSLIKVNTARQNTTIPNLLQHNNLMYIWLSKFEAEYSDGRFVLYSQLSECNYLVSVKDVMDSERKLKIKRLLRFFTASKCRSDS